MRRRIGKYELHNAVVDLFSGAGGFSLGAARAGFTVLGAIELDSKAIVAHRRNFPTCIALEADIAETTGVWLKNELSLRNGDLSGIIGGSPCQGFSAIGRRCMCDPRNELFVDFFRIVSEALPKFYLAENVPGIMDKRNAAIRERAFSYIEKDYVILPPMTLAAEKYGAPTIRKRVFFVGYRKDEMEPLLTEDFEPSPDIEVIRVNGALRGLPKKINPHWQSEDDSWRVVRVYGDGYFASRLHGHVPEGVGDFVALERLARENRASGFLGTLHSDEISKRYGQIEPGKRDPISKSHRLDPDGFCPTLRAGTDSARGGFQAVRPLHPTENRVITPREAARLQGFPDWFQFSPTKWQSFRQIGSSVSPILAERILVVIRHAVDGTRP